MIPDEDFEKWWGGDTAMYGLSLNDERIARLAYLAAAHAEGENLHAKMRELDAALMAALKAKEEAERNAQRYLHIREHGIPCSDPDLCGSSIGDELDAQIDAARKP